MTYNPNGSGSVGYASYGSPWRCASPKPCYRKVPAQPPSAPSLRAPHDDKVHEVGSSGARTRIETLVTLGRKPELVPNQDLMEGTHAKAARHRNGPGRRFEVGI
jgi:hypothetical protein